jgi:hypothetical protein
MHASREPDHGFHFGVEYDERHDGTYYLSSDPPTLRAFSFQLRIATPRIGEFLRETSALAEGRIHAEGIAEDAVASGLVTWKRAERRIAYSLEFQADDGRVLAFVGEKDLHFTLGLRALTHLVGSLFHLPEQGGSLCQSASREEIGRASLAFDLRHGAWPMLRSARLLIPGFSFGLSGRSR